MASETICAVHETSLLSDAGRRAGLRTPGAKMRKSVSNKLQLYELHESFDDEKCFALIIIIPAMSKLTTTIEPIRLQPERVDVSFCIMEKRIKFIQSASIFNDL